MNRREALAALTALPEVTRITVARPQPGDVIVMERDKTMKAWTPEQVDAVRDALQRVWPGQTVVVLPPGCSLKMVERGS